MPLVSFLSDFGLRDSYVGQVKAVMLTACDSLVVVDITHDVPAQDVVEGAFQLMSAIGSFPRGTVHLAVVDPGVGTERKGIAARLAGHTLVGPDNGLLTLALRRLADLHDVVLDEQHGYLAAAPPLVAVELTVEQFWRQPVAPTFHARDIFGPVAARLASGVQLEVLGPLLARLTNLPFPTPIQTSERTLVGQIVHVDRFGNLTSNLPASLVPAQAIVRVGEATIAGLQPTYGHGHEPVALIGSAGYLEVAVPGGDAARQLGLQRGDELVVELATSKPVAVRNWR